MSKILAMFPGQGSQYVGMGKDLLTEFPSTRAVFEEAEDACKVAIRRLCLEGPEDQLRLTANTQPCILAISIAAWTVLKAEAPIEPYAYAGHSLGEYSALVASGKLALSRAAFLVRRRGEAMQAAVPAGVGSMAAVLNVAEGDLLQHCRKITDSSPSMVLEIVNYNAPGQLVVAGHKNAVESLCSHLDGAGHRAVQLPVSAPFHSSLMQPAKEAMAPLIQDSPLLNNDHRVIANLSGQVESHYSHSCLTEQIAAPVLWTQTLATASEIGCDSFVEVGPGKVLFGLARRTVPKTSKILHSDDIRKAIADVQALV